MIRVDERGMDALVRELGATEKQVAAAMRSTIARMANWSRTRVRRGLSKELKIQQKQLKRRVTARTRKEEAVVWVGLNDMPPEALGARYVRQVLSDTRPPRAFRHPKTRKIVRRVGKGRYPIQRVLVSIQQRGMRWLEDGFLETPGFREQFQREFERQLRWRTR